MCHESLPPLFKTGDRQAAACFLYEDSPPVMGEDAAGMLLTSREHSDSNGTHNSA